MEQTHKDVVRRYHTLCSMLALEDYEKEALLSPYGCTSSSQMQTQDLINVCGYLSKRIDGRGEMGELNKLRKRVIAAIGAELKAQGIKTENPAAYIKSIACRITGYKQFNSIPRERLRNIIGMMNNKAKDRAQLAAVMEGKDVAVAIEALCVGTRQATAIAEA